MESDIWNNEVGGFVRVRHQPGAGIGKLMAVKGRLGIVEHFISIRDRRSKAFDLNDLERLRTLSPQTRVYVQSDNGWHFGRAMRHCGTDIEILFSGGGAAYVARDRVFVRCDLPGEDPVQTLIAYGHDTPYYYERRAAFVRHYTQLRNAWHGLDAFASARIEVLAHQLEVVRRVLNDPVQRYLLADEVGLGKTVEAGVILRQLLLDDDSATGLVLVPPQLVSQWQRELATRLGLQDELDENRIAVIGTHDTRPLLRLSKAARVPRMLVIDEAHHVGAGVVPGASSAARELYALVETLSQRTPHLLLLSATPVLHHEEQFLAMLHLLDPDIYRLEDRDTFLDRIRQRQEIGAALVGLKPEAPAFVLKSRIGKLKTLFPNDTRLAELLEECEKAAAVQRASAITAVRVHVAETYRLHQRLLRNRRAAVFSQPDAPISDRCTSAEAKSPSETLCEPLIDERAEAVERYVEQWRARAAGITTELQHHTLSRIYRILLQASATWWGVLSAIIRVRLGTGATEHERSAFACFGDDATILKSAPLFTGEADLLSELLTTVETPAHSGSDRLDLAVLTIDRLLCRGMKRVVVFSSFRPTALELLSRLGRSPLTDPADYSPAVCALVSDSRYDTERELDVFGDSSRSALLVCDTIGEEGHNLQSADAVVHVDIPLAPLRLEQRIGRVDRIGRMAPARTRVLSCWDEDSASGVWLRVLAEGLGIFSQAAADLQFYLDSAPSRWLDILFTHGPEALNEMVEGIRKEVADERQRIAEQAAIDEIEAADVEPSEWIARLRETEEDERPIRQGFERWLCETLRVEREEDEARPDVFFYRAHDRTLIPANQWHSWPGHQDRLTYSRIEAALRPDVRLLRPGESFVEELARYVQWDDRGRVYAVYRHDRTMPVEPGEEWVGFRFDMVVEGDIRAAEIALRSATQSGESACHTRMLRRRFDALLPPTYDSVYINHAGYEVSDPHLIELLRRPYAKRKDAGSDTNLQDEQLEVLRDIVDPGTWQAVCEHASQAAQAIVLARARQSAACDAAVRLARRDTDLRLSRLRLREALQADVEGDLQLELLLSEPLIAGLQHPSVRVDSVGLYVLSGNDRFAPAHY